MSEKNHINIVMANNYSYAQEFWGEFYYRSYGEMTAQEARDRCNRDGASLPVPGSAFENAFYADLYPDGQVWLGLTTVHDGSTTHEGNCTVDGENCGLKPIITSTFDGSEALFTNWGRDVHDDRENEWRFAENTSANGAYAYIDNRQMGLGVFADTNFWNNNKSDSDLANAVCVYKIPS